MHARTARLQARAPEIVPDDRMAADAPGRHHVEQNPMCRAARSAGATWELPALLPSKIQSSVTRWPSTTAV
jgi:hypothetical protein